MARPPAPSPTGPRRVLSASTLLKNPSLQPIIASRSVGSKEPMETPARLSQVRYYNDRASYLTTPRNMYDCEDDLSSYSTFVPYSHRQQTQIHRLDDGFGGHVDGKGPPPVFYGHSPIPRVPRPRPPRRELHGGRRFGRRDFEYSSVKPSGCHVFLKILELLVCLAVVVVTRVGENDLRLDMLFTMFGVFGLLVSGCSLLLLWVKGQPAPGNCLHTTTLLFYGIAIPVLLCGAIMVLLIQKESNTYVTVLAALFFFGVFLFCVDMVVMAVAILRCQCWGAEPTYPHRHPRTYPLPAHCDDDDFDYYYHHHHSPRRHHGDYHRHHHQYPQYPPKDPRYPRGYPPMMDPSYPTSLPQMSTWRDYQR